MDVSSAAARGPGSKAERVEREKELRQDLAGIARGDQAALARFYDHTSRLVFALALRLVHDRHLADDVLLEVYVQVWKSAASFDDARGAVLNWLMTVTRTRAIDCRRRRRSQTRTEAAWQGELGERRVSDRACERDELAAHADRERDRSVRRAIATLPEPQRLAVELAFLRELSHTQIAERVGEPLGTIKTRIRLGIIKLRETLAGWEDDG